MTSADAKNENVDVNTASPGPISSAINANINLQALGITASALGGRLTVNGDIADTAVLDDGLTNPLWLDVSDTQLWWGNIDTGSTTTYDVMMGSLDELRARADLSSPMVTFGCLVDSQVQTGGSAPGMLAPGQSVWYLVRAQPGGTYDSGGIGQNSGRDAEIGASGNDCP